MEQESVLGLIGEMAEVLVSSKWITERCTYQELASVIWFFSTIDSCDTIDRYPKLWQDLTDALENFS